MGTETRAFNQGIPTNTPLPSMELDPNYVQVSGLRSA
jgi:hypothetical protein